MKALTKISRALLTVLLMVTFGFSYATMAQDEDDIDVMEAAQCGPEDYTTAYDKFADPSISPDQVSIWYDYGREYHKKGQYGGAKENYTLAVPYFWKVVINDKTGAFKIVYSKLIDCYLNTNLPDSALFVAYHGLKQYPDYATLHYHAGFLEQSKGNIECAIPHYEALVADKSQKKETLKNYYNILAQLYLQMEDEKAIEAQKEVVNLDPENVEATITLARMMEIFGLDPFKAREEAFLKDTTNVINARQYGMAAFDAGKYDKALRAFQAVLVQDPQNIEAMSYIGRCYEAKDQLSNAIRIYKNILDIDPDKLNTLVSLASVYGRLNEFSVARNYIRRAINKDAGFGMAYMVMGEIYENAVMHCSNQREKKGYTYDDKLVFELARDEYRKAASRDANMASSAQSRVNQLAPFVRTIEDKHMNANRDTLKDGCYSWISTNL